MNNMKDILIAALKRAGWTAIETALAMIPVGAAVEEVEWLHILSVVAVASLIAFLKSILITMPEITLQQQVQQLQGDAEDEIVPQPESDEPSATDD